jgi:ATP-dependent Clp protease ATP-binding subunit ClpB
VLFDEIEKANKEVFNVFLQVLDDGRLTDGQGRTVDFRNTVIIMTSNVGSQYLADVTDEEMMEEQVMAALRAEFRPEFLNRIDEIVLFHRLGKEQLRQILDVQLRRVRELLAGRNVTVALTDAAADYLTSEGYDPSYGARPLKRVLAKQVIDPLALKLLEGDVRDGDHVVIDTKDGLLVFDVVEPAEVEDVIE